MSRATFEFRDNEGQRHWLDIKIDDESIEPLELQVDGVRMIRADAYDALTGAIEAARLGYTRCDIFDSDGWQCVLMKEHDSSCLCLPIK